MRSPLCLGVWSSGVVFDEVIASILFVQAHLPYHIVASLMTLINKNLMTYH